MKSKNHNPLLKINDLKITYNSGENEFPALKNLCLEIKQGEIIGIAGESGSGKTSLCKAIMGVVPGETAGEIIYQGRNLLSNNEKDWKKFRWNQIAYCFSSSQEILNPSYTIVEQMVETMMEHRLWNKRQAALRARELLTYCRLSVQKHDAYPVHLSGGELQRVLIALTLVNDPEILIFDEPTSGLDPRTKKEILALLAEILSTKTGIIVSHDFLLLEEISHRLGILYAGELIEMSTTPEFFANPRHPYSRALLNSFDSIKTGREIMPIRGKLSIDRSQECCVFADRCTQSLETCTRVKPLLRDYQGRFLACHRGGVIDLLQGVNISKSYNISTNPLKKKNLKVLKNINIHIEAGEVVSLIGESGAGKTSLGKIIAGILPSDTGKIISDQTVEPFDIQYIFQDPRSAISHRFTVNQAVAEPLVIRKGVKSEKLHQEVEARLLQVGLPIDDEFGNKYCYQLSSGELQRIAIARALIVKPRIIIADEPTSNLDSSEKARIIKLLLALQNENGMGLLLITHDMLIARKVSRRIYVIQEGEIVEEGLSANLLTYSSNLYTRELLKQVNSEV